MAQDATGTPSTNFSFPKYNVNVDAPSGLGLNAIVDDIDSKLFSRFVQSTASKTTNNVPVWNGSAWTWAFIKDANVDSAAAISYTKLVIPIARIASSGTTVTNAEGEKQLPVAVETDPAGLGTIVSNDYRIDVAGTYLLIPSMYTANLGGGSQQRAVIRYNPAGANSVLTDVYVGAGETTAGDDRWIAGVSAVGAFAANDVIRLKGANSEATARQIDVHLILIRVGA